MFNLDMIINKLEPYFQTCAGQLREFEHRLFARLDLMLLASQEDDFELSDPRMRVWINLIDGTIDLAEVPNTEEWLVEGVSFQTAAPSYLIIRSGGRLIFNQATQFGDVIIPGGSILTVEAEATGEAYFQFRRRMPRERIKHMVGGMREVSQPGGMPRRILNQDDQQSGFQQHHPLEKIG